MGQFLGFSDEHCTLVTRVRDLVTILFSPQFDVVFDEKFFTIHNHTRLSDTAIESIFNDLFESCVDYVGEDTAMTPEGASATISTPTAVVDETPELGDK